MKGWLPGTHGVALAFMALAIVAGGAATVAGPYVDYLKAAAGIATSLAALFIHPPFSGPTA